MAAESTSAAAALIGSVRMLARKPVLFLPSVIAVVLILVLSYVFAPLLENIAFNVLVLGKVPDVALSALPFQFAAMYAADLLALLLFMVLVGVLFIALAFWYALFLRDAAAGKASFVQTCRETVAAVEKIVALVLFVLVIAVFVAVLFWFFALVESVLAPLGVVLTAVLAIAMLYLYINLAFTVQALAISGKKVKDALQQSWRFVAGRFLHTVVFLVVLAVVYYALISAGLALSDAALDEATELGSVAVFWVIAASYANVAMAQYYLGEKQ